MKNKVNELLGSKLECSSYLEAPNVMTTKKLKNELTLKEAALAIFTNGWDQDSWEVEAHLKEEYEHFGWHFGPYKYDEIYDEVFTACVDGSLRIANSARLGMVPIPDYYIYIDIDDLVNWMLVQKRDGENLVPSCLASACSFSELFQFYDKDSEAKGIYKESKRNPTPDLALYFGDRVSKDSQALVALQRELKLARQEISRLESALKKNDELFEGKFPKEATLLKIIEQLRRLHLYGTYDKKAQYRTNEELNNVQVDEFENSLLYVSKRHLQASFAAAKKLSS